MTVNIEKAFAFVEFKMPQDATIGMSLDGSIYEGVPLRVKRPKDYYATHGQEEESRPAAAESPNKIFIGGLPPYLNEHQVKELLISFGELRSFNFISDEKDGKVTKVC